MADRIEPDLLALKKPYIIFIISDDQAYADYHFMGHEFIEMPNIDRLAEQSLTFTRGYASAPLCSPSLASIITGLYAFQHGITGIDPVVEYEGEKRAEKRAGYYSKDVQLFNLAEDPSELTNVAAEYPEEVVRLT